MKTSNMLGILLMAIAVLAMAPAAALAQQSTSDPDAKCLKCHSKKLKKTLEDGETMFLQVSADDFGQSVHRVIGCTGCHRDVPKGKHPSRQPISSQRDYSLKHNDTCRQCHAAKYTDYKHSVHASLVAEGDARAPVCSDCHSAHAIQERAVYEPVSGEPCSKCHGDIYDAYAQSVHGLARANGFMGWPAPTATSFARGTSRRRSAPTVTSHMTSTPWPPATTCAAPVSTAMTGRPSLMKNGCRTRPCT